jgi:hypothetical protein
MARSIHCYPNYFISFAQPLSPYCEQSVYIHISDCVETEHELLMLANNTASGMSLHKLAVMCSVDCIFITGLHAWW